MTTEESFTILDVGHRKLEPRTGRIWKQTDGHIKMLIPIGIESLFDYARCVCLFRVNDDDRDWVGKAEDIEFGQAIGSNN
jgi:hypothetical protein